MKEINSNKETLKRNLLDLIELQHILKKTQVFFQEVSNHPLHTYTCLVCTLYVCNGRQRPRVCVQDGSVG